MTTEHQEMTGNEEKIKVWPEMVLRETIAAIIAVIALLALAMYLDAPLESIADPSLSANPSKAPWYFLGLQELLVYFRPWIAGVLIPACILLVLAVIPYLDIRGGALSAEGGYPLEKEINILFSGGLILWIILTVVGFYLRGPNWRLQLPDGTLLGENAAVASIDWLVPAVAGAYPLLLLSRLKRLRQKNNTIGPVRLLLAHAMITGALVVITTICIQTIVSL